jgi:hypothetical protein
MTVKRGCCVPLLQARDRLERLALAHGERVAANAIPPGLLWTCSGPMTQRVYFWEWARDASWLYGRLHDADRDGGCWRLPASYEVLRLHDKITLEVVHMRPKIK